MTSIIPGGLPSSIDGYQKLLNGLKALPPDLKWEETRNLCRMDLFFLLAFVLMRLDAMHPWIFQRCREVQAQPNGFLDLWSREHYKSTIITYALTIQEILKNPEVTIGIFSHTRPIAKAFLRQIKRELEANVVLKELFPDILWENANSQSPKWSEDEGIIVKRSGNPKEATVEAWGLVDGQPTSKHYGLRIYDDVVTRESVTTPEQIKKTTEAWELSDNLGTRDGIVRVIGTRYNLYDTYSVMIQRGAFTPRLHAATHNGRMDGKPVFFEQKVWDRKKKTQSRRMIAAQLLQNPLADEDARFMPLWLKPYEVRPRTLNISITCDPSLGRRKNSDNTAIAVIGYAKGGAKYLLDGYCHRMSLSQRWGYLRDLYNKWSAMPGVQNITVGYERYGQQADQEYFDERMRIEKIVFSIRELSWVRENDQSKEHRVDRLEPDFRNSRFYLPLSVWKDGRPHRWRADDDPESKSYQAVLWTPVADIIEAGGESITTTQQRAIDSGNDDLVCKAIKKVDNEKQIYDLTNRFIEEYLNFPFGEHDDLIDAASRIYDMEMIEPTIISKTSTDPAIYYDS